MKKIMSVFMMLTLGLCSQTKCLCEAQDNVKIIKVPCVEESRNGASNKESKVYSGAKLIKTKVKAVASGVSKQIAKGSMAVKSGSTKLKDQLTRLATSAEPKVAAVSHFLSKPVVLGSVSATSGLAGIAGLVYYFIFRDSNKPEGNQTVEMCGLWPEENYAVCPSNATLTTAQQVPLYFDGVAAEVSQPALDIGNVTAANAALNNANDLTLNLDNNKAETVPLTTATQTALTNGPALGTDSTVPTPQPVYSSDSMTAVTEPSVTKAEKDCVSINCDVTECALLFPTNVDGLNVRNMVKTARSRPMEMLPRDGECREKAFAYGYYADLIRQYGDVGLKFNLGEIVCKKWIYEAHGSEHVDYNHAKSAEDKVTSCYKKYFNADVTPKFPKDYKEIRKFYEDPLSYKK